MDAPISTLRPLNLDPGQIIAGRFEICEKIGSGGMGLVYRALDRELNDVVALKLLHPHLAQDENLFKRFRNEVLVARSLSHPNIVRLHDIGKTDEGFSYISMEFVDGTSLKERIQRPGNTAEETLSFEESLPIYYQILNAVAYAHGKGIIHRDLKPANVLLSKSGDVKLADFGTARITRADTSLTQTGEMIGTPDYMAPEQIRGEKLDSACDIYALGIMGYELAVGERPYVADSSVAVAFKHLSEPIPPFANVGKGIPQWYEDMVVRATAKKKEDRFQSAADFARVLAQHSSSVAQMTGYYPSTGTMFFPPSGSATGLPAPGQGPSHGGATQHGSADPAASRRGVEKYELGTSDQKIETDSWKLDVSSLRGGKEVEERSKGVEERSKGIWAFLGVVGILLVGAGVLFVLPSKKASVPAQPPKEIALELPPEQLETSTSVSPDVKVIPSVTLAEPTTVTSPPTTLSVQEIEKRKAEEDAAENARTELAALEAAKQKEAEEIAKENISSSFRLENATQGVVKSELSADEAAGIRWIADLSGFRVLNDERVQKELKQLSVSVFDRNESKVVTKLPPGRIVEQSSAGGMLRLGGSFGEKAAAKLKGGSYRIDLLRAGRMVASKEITIRVPQVVESQPQPSSQSPSQPPSPSQSQSTPLVETGLPPAMGSVTESISPAPPVEPPTEQPVAESYSGVIRFTEPAGEELAVSISIQQSSDGAVSGSATITGIGDFSVEGKILPRGIELYFRNTESAARLAGTIRKGDVIRGRFSMPNEKKSGTLEAKFIK